MFGRTIAALFAVALTSGCQTASVDVRHAKTDKGYLNSRLASLGYLFVWDTENNSINQLAVIDLTQRSADDRYATLEATQVAGIGISANIAATVRAEIEAEVQSKTSLTLTDAHVVSFSDTFGDLSAEINRRIAEGENIRETWFLDEAAQPGSRYRYLLVYRSITADSTKLEFDKSVAAGGVLTIPTGGWGGDVKVKLSGFGSSTFIGNDVTTLVDYYIIKTYFGTDANGNVTYNFKIDTSIAGGFVLSPILRGL
jgi:hypothetical protein